jgi:hypothetical protein
MQVILAREHDDCNANSSIQSNWFYKYFEYHNNMVILTPHSGNESAAMMRLGKPSKRKEVAAAKIFMIAAMQIDTFQVRE